MKTEISAGGIVVRNIRGLWEVLVLQDMNDAWTFPKGKIDTGEMPRQAARREIQEEVGIRDIHMRRKLPAIHYIYIKKTALSAKPFTIIFLNQTGMKNSSIKQMKEFIMRHGYRYWTQSTS